MPNEGSRLDQLRAKVTAEQKELLRRLWELADHRTDLVLAKLLFHGLHPVSAYRRALDALGGSVVGEMRGGMEETYGLTLLGALLHEHGLEFENLLGRYLAYLVERYNADPTVKEITRTDTERDMRLSEPALSDLPRLVNMASPSLCNGCMRGDGTWSLNVPREIHDLTEVVDWSHFIQERALVGYDPNRPVRPDGRPGLRRQRMEDRPTSFSKRHGYTVPAAEITIREGAPEETRLAILHLARDAEMTPSTLREVVCRVLLCAPDTNNWSDYPNIWEEVQRLVLKCPWFRVYDIAEAVYTALVRRSPGTASRFAESLNEHFRERGVGWQLVDGRIETRGPEAFEASVREARQALDSAGFPTASNEIHEALLDLSRRPEPDITGAIQHSMAALEAVARRACGDEKATLGDIMKRNQGLLPRPLDVVVEKVWGYASEMGRHLREGRAPARDEAELVVSVVAAVATYLVQKLG